MSPPELSAEFAHASENDRTSLSKDSFKRAFLDNLFYTQGKFLSVATHMDYYLALAYTVRDRLLYRWVSTATAYTEHASRTVSYLSAEFLMGPSLGNNLINLGIREEVRQAIAELGLELDDLLEQEAEPGLGNGGLGRLAACFIDSLASLELPALGYGIRYEHGIFYQTLRDGWQVENTDNWLRFGNPWEVRRPEWSVEVKLGGYTESYIDAEDRHRVRWVPAKTVVGVPFDSPIPGYRVNTANTLRLWSAEATQSFDFEVFNRGDYLGAVSKKVTSENLTKILYPNDETPQGKELRLEQQYFFVACSLRDMFRIIEGQGVSIERFHEKFAVQLNDTHPAIGVAELMRILVDDHVLPWNEAWAITTRTFGYTNHTLLPEALERWPLELFRRVLPRHLEIIFEINDRFLHDVRIAFLGDDTKVRALSLIDESGERYVRMAHLASVGSYAINGVATLHSELLKQDVLSDFHALWPEKFHSVTNGVTPRRWMALANPRLTALLHDTIGDGWIRNLDQLRELEGYAENPAFGQRWREIKRANKVQLAELLEKRTGIEVDPESMFDVQVKRIHEYKRQHLAVLQIIAMYHRLKSNPESEIVPRTFIFSGKAAPGYFMAKLMIRLITAVGDVINYDPEVRDRLKVVFMPNFSVTTGQRIYPGADLSEQVSLAGKEASGTGNMKFAMNGALTIGTMDGANIEICEEVGAENFFTFGMTAAEVDARRREGYKPREVIEANPELHAVVELIRNGLFSRGDTELFRPIVDSLLWHDPYMLAADYASYSACQLEVDDAYRDIARWTRMSVLNVARSGKFSSDRSIEEYAKKIWKISPVAVQLL